MSLDGSSWNTEKETLRGKQEVVGVGVIRERVIGSDNVWGPGLLRPSHSELGEGRGGQRHRKGARSST